MAQVHFDELALDLMQMALEFEETFGEQRLARAGGTGDEDRIGRVRRDLFEFLDDPVEGGVAGRDARLEADDPIGVLTHEAGGECIVLREVKIDDADMAHRAFAARSGCSGGGGLGYAAIQ